MGSRLSGSWQWVKTFRSVMFYQHENHFASALITALIASMITGGPCSCSLNACHPQPAGCDGSIYRTESQGERAAKSHLGSQLFKLQGVGIRLLAFKLGEFSDRTVSAPLGVCCLPHTRRHMIWQPCWGSASCQELNERLPLNRPTSIMEERGGHDQYYYYLALI